MFIDTLYTKYYNNFNQSITWINLYEAWINVQNIEFPSLNNVINNVNFKILEHGYLETGDEWRFLNLSSPFNRLYFVISGSATITNSHNNVSLNPGNVYVIPLYNTYDYKCLDKLHKFYIHFRIEYIPGHDLFEGQKYCKSLPMDSSKLDTLLECIKSNDIGNFITGKGIILDFVGRFISEFSENISDQINITNKYIKLYDFVRSNCSASLRVTDLVKFMGISLSKLSKDFKNDTGVTLKNYLDSKIIQKAQELLLVTDLSIKKISSDLGFLDEFHFSRFFKRHVNISPNIYRQRNNTFK